MIKSTNNLATSSRFIDLKRLKQFSIVKWDGFYWSVFILCLVLAVRPIIVFLNSSNEFSLSLIDVAFFSGIFFIYAYGISLLIGFFFRGEKFSNQRKILSSIILGLAVMFWLQGNIFLWDYGKLDGSPMNFSDYTVHGFIEAFLWITVLGYFILKFKHVSAWANKIALIILVNIAISVVIAYRDRPIDAWHKNYHVSFDNYLEFSKTKNVIIMVIDAARGDVFDEMLHDMTNDEKKIFDGFTFFKNTSGTFNSTDPAVSGFLTGRLYDYKNAKQSAYHEIFTSSTSLPFQLKKRGFITEVYPYHYNSVYISPEIVDNLKINQALDPEDFLALRKKDQQKIALVTRFNFSPHFIKKLFFEPSDMYARTSSIAVQVESVNSLTSENNVTELPEKILGHLNYNRSLIDKLESNLTFRPEPVFKYLHFHGAHPPFFHDENYIGRRLPFSLESYKKQYKGSLLLTLEALVKSLRREGVYENTLLIVIGDHGLYIPEFNDISDINFKFNHLISILAPLMIIKPFGDFSDPIKKSSAPVSLFDIPATVFCALDLSTHNIGSPVFSVLENERRSRFVYFQVPKRKGLRSDKGGALEYKIEGDVNEIKSWNFNYGFLKPGKGKILIDQAEYESRSKSILELVNNTNIFEIE